MTIVVRYNSGMKTIVVIQADESVEDQIESILKEHKKGVEILRPNSYKEAFIALENCGTLIINPKGQKDFMMSQLIGLALRLGIHIVQCIPDGNPDTERVISI